MTASTAASGTGGRAPAASGELGRENAAQAQEPSRPLPAPEGAGAVLAARPRTNGHDRAARGRPSAGAARAAGPPQGTQSSPWAHVLEAPGGAGPGGTLPGGPPQSPSPPNPTQVAPAPAPATPALRPPTAHTLAVRLEHPQLGPVDVRVQVQGPKVAAALGVGNEVARAALVADAPRLAAALSQHGLRLGDMQVATGGGRGGAGTGGERGSPPPARAAPVAAKAPAGTAQGLRAGGGRLDLVV